MRPVASNTAPTTVVRPASRSVTACRAARSAPKWSTLYSEIPRAMKTGHAELRPQSMVLRIEHDSSGKATGVLYADKDGKPSAEGTRGVRGRQFDRISAAAAQLRVEPVPQRSGELVGAGRSQTSMNHTTAAALTINPARP